MLGTRAFLQLASRALDSWSQDNAFRLSAALAYYGVFALAPVLIIAIAIAGSIFGPKAARGQVMYQIQGLIGPGPALAVQDLLRTASSSGLLNAASIAGFVALFIGATGVFVALQDGLNTVWRVKQKPENVVIMFLRQRLYTFLLVLGVGVLLLVVLVASAVLAAVGQFTGIGAGLWGVVNTGVSFALVVAVFGLVFKFVPDVYVDWRDVWIGAVITAVLFTAGKYGIGLYLGRSSLTSVYGAAGTLVLVLAWVYYSALILFLGAEFIRVYADYRGRAVIAKPNAVLMTAEDSLEQGLDPRRPPR